MKQLQSAVYQRLTTFALDTNIRELIYTYEVIYLFRPIFEKKFVGKKALKEYYNSLKRKNKTDSHEMIRTILKVLQKYRFHIEDIIGESPECAPIKQIQTD